MLLPAIANSSSRLSAAQSYSQQLFLRWLKSFAKRTSERARTGRPLRVGERNRSRGRGLRLDLAGGERCVARFRMLKVGAIRLVLQRSSIMTSTQPGVSPLRQRMTDDMRMRQLSPKTQAGYLRIVREFARYLKRSPDTATVEDLRNYQ